MQKADCEALRREIKPIAEKLWALRDGATAEGVIVASEIIANVTLAYRHLEDASMRLGKAIQAIDGGISVYDQTQVPKSAA